MPAGERTPRAVNRETISELTTGRLSIYLRCLEHLESLQIRTISSQALAEQFHLNSAQIRKDLACLGEFGIRGVGYDVAALKQHLVDTLGLTRVRTLVIAGAGNLGMALVNYQGFNARGFQVVAMVDDDPAKIGKRSKSGVPIFETSELSRIVQEHQVEIGVIAVPGPAAQSVLDAMVAAGIRAALNFAPAHLSTHQEIKVKDVDLRINLESLSFYLRNCADTYPSR
ncbi:MAG TPA: redox-sensing transcriptional repressor Rex [Thermoanaerobaculia bacterium]|nr:redox-sensing transcriptional repressor Rex [Thermoanaerobaculia bacterium]